MYSKIFLICLGCLLATQLFAQKALKASYEANPAYDIVNIPMPKGEVLEIVSITLLPKDEVCVTTRRGDVWIAAGVFGEDVSQVKWRLFARGLREGFGSFFKDGNIHVLQKGELTKLQDTSGDGKADFFEVVSDNWGLGHNLHDFVFGSKPDKNGDVWATLCLTGSSRSETPFRGWAIRIQSDGKVVPTVSGLRSPGGVGFDPDGMAFYTDNQGHWNGSSSIKPLLPGTFVGNPSSLKWYDQAPEMGEKPPEPEVPSRIQIQRQRIKQFVPPAVIFPHGLIGQSPTGIVSNTTKGKFGPYEKQLFVGEITHSQVQRVMLEKVNGVYQGAVVNFLAGIDFGVVATEMDQERGVLLLGGTNRGWGSRGKKSFGLAKVTWNGKKSFTVLDMKATKDGFKLTFSEALDKATLEQIKMDSFGYIYHSKYGSPVVDEAQHEITKSALSEDGKSIELSVKDRVQGSVHRVDLSGLKSASGASIQHSDVFYTLNEIPAE